MKALLIARREMFAYLRSPLGSIVIAAALLLDGLLFYNFGLTERALSAEVLATFFFYAGGIGAIAAIVLGTRLLAEERQSGSIVLLNTAPIRDRDIVLGKFLSAFAVVTAMTLLTLYMPLLIFVNGKVSVGHIVVGYVGMLLYAGAALSIALFASSLTRSQVVAMIVAGAIAGALVVMWMVARAVDPPLNDFFSALALHHENFQPFMTGVLELQRVGYYLALIFFFLLAATKTLEARRWR
jgi:ABC-2 type transport system permease protein